ncbi:DUF6207 family protein [Streptomyces tauricus]|uniref:DUF6207 family protein n=1 Tax=Streptomyces tauricus TaxID=68274 RepID=UPI0033A92B0D
MVQRDALHEPDQRNTRGETGLIVLIVAAADDATAFAFQQLLADRRATPTAQETTRHVGEPGGTASLLRGPSPEAHLTGRGPDPPLQVATLPVGVRSSQALVSALNAACASAGRAPDDGARRAARSRGRGAPGPSTRSCRPLSVQ